LNGGNAGGWKAIVVPGHQFCQDVANPLRLATTTTPVFVAGNTLFHDFSTSNSPDYTECYTFVNYTWFGFACVKIHKIARLYGF
jgi:hypothetical protein